MTEHNDERALILRINEGDRSAFSVLYSRYLHVLYRYVYLFTKSKETSEDIVHNVFIKIWEHRTSLNNVNCFKAYLYQCAKNMLLDEIRRNQTREKVLSLLTDGKEETGEELESRIIYGDYYRIAQDAINLLPERRKLIVEMRTKEDLSLDEIAQKLHISKFVVKKQLYSGLHFIKAHLQKHAELTLFLALFLAPFDL
ncbi:RNA polymerase sigma-70 factor [Mucilaginibacter sp. ZT4R22]|uniref:RNA polymerase sigma-70 factor n=1 Tax=Mucilaginibacter pankratovii TaxID=2772110 RepID=A0ABR7WUK9_9SPHI|nr:RNA polymerase sigma-70 factor [Mucilaginibacter pankratovii]MBD1365985.1 RNA polymerase sigma-70 factor [Mucilaginibacter pankratovii]